jgi:uncharacterized membrane protein YkoI
MGALATPTVTVATSAFADQKTPQNQHETGQNEQNEQNERVVKLSDIPAPARQGLEREAKGATITKVEQSQQNGRTVYEAHVKQGKQERGIVVDASGKLVGSHSAQNEKQPAQSQNMKQK